jgi:hypothetical protein
MEQPKTSAKDRIPRRAVPLEGCSSTDALQAHPLPNVQQGNHKGQFRSFVESISSGVLALCHVYSKSWQTRRLQGSVYEVAVEGAEAAKETNRRGETKMGTEQEKINGSQKDAKGTPRSLTIANKGIKSSDDFANLMSSLMSDLIEGKVTASVGNATCNAGGKLLKMVEMTYKYGSPNGQSNPKKTLTIAFESQPDCNDGQKKIADK